jgi:hypothetical protein
MKDQYLVGIPKKDFIRITDGVILIGGSLTLEEAKDAKKIMKRSKIYKLIEVKK